MLFAVRTWFKHYSLLPLVGSLATACALAASYSTFALFTKPDVSLHPGDYSVNSRYHNQTSTEVKKLINMNKGRIQVDPEIEALKAEISSIKPL